MDTIKKLREALGPTCAWLTDEGIVSQAIAEIAAHRTYMTALHPYINPHLTLEDDLKRITGMIKPNAGLHRTSVAQHNEKG